MALRTGITHETRRDQTAQMPFTLKDIELVGKDDKYNWCWTACAVIVMRYLKEDWRKEKDTHKLLCERVANIAYKGITRLARYGSCCPPDRCDVTLSADDVTDLWKQLLSPRQSKPLKRGDFPDFDVFVDSVAGEIITHLRPVEVGLKEDARTGHLVIIYGYHKTEKMFYVLDPDFALKVISASNLFERCKDIWFNLTTS